MNEPCWLCEFAEEHNFGEDGTELFCHKKNDWVHDHDSCDSWVYAEIPPYEKRRQKEASKKWISVGSDLPEDGLPVLCADTSGNQYVAWHSYFGGWYDQYTRTMITNTIAWWMPLPSLPKGE